MHQRHPERLGRAISEVGLGCWQLGADWGEVDDATAREVLHAALDAGVTFLDTADVYGDGRSERLVGEVVAARGPREDVLIATKAGRRADPHVPEAYTATALRGWIQRSLDNLGVERLDLLQLHCPPTPVYDDDAAFDALDTMVTEGLLAAYGVSVETTAEALRAIERPNVATLQIILNAFRRKPLDAVLPAAADAGVGIIARVPLASGLLTGRYDHDTSFAADDHRTYNRDGAAFDVGETFAGVPFDVGVDAARQVAALATETTAAQLALRWILDQPAVSTVIPGARSTSQVAGNVAASDLPALDADTQARLSAIYDASIRTHVHHRW